MSKNAAASAYIYIVYKAVSTFRSKVIQVKSRVRIPLSMD